MLVVDGVEVLDVREAAAYVDRTTETVRRWVWSGRLTAIRRGNRLLVSRADLDAVRTRRSTEQAGRAGPAERPILTLAQWAVAIPRESRAPVGGHRSDSASELVLQDRRADDHGR